MMGFPVAKTDLIKFKNEQIQANLTFPDKQIYKVVSYNIQYIADCVLLRTSLILQTLSDSQIKKTKNKTDWIAKRHFCKHYFNYYARHLVCKIYLFFVLIPSHPEPNVTSC